MELQRQINTYQEQKMRMTPALSQRAQQTPHTGHSQHSLSAQSLISGLQQSPQQHNRSPFPLGSSRSTYSASHSARSEVNGQANGQRVSGFDGVWSSMNGNAQMQIRGLDVIWGR
jgi:hypothetical protein